MSGLALREVAVDISLDVLERYALGDDVLPSAYAHEPGPPVLIAALHATGALPPELGSHAAHRWLNEQKPALRALGAFGGLGGLLAGYHALVRFDPGFERSEASMRSLVARALDGAIWRTAGVAWRDYDLFQGPSGLISGGLIDSSWLRDLKPAITQLLNLCAAASLENLRAGTEVLPPSEFNIGRINTGMAHGVAGVAAALRQIHAVAPRAEGILEALERCCAWLLSEAYVAQSGLIAWAPAGREGSNFFPTSPRPQAWCYGTPGVAWTLWDSGVMLNDPDLQLLGLEAMRRYCMSFDADVRLNANDPRDALGICHGAAGILAVTTAFVRHAELPEAADLREELVSYIVDRRPDITGMSSRAVDLLNGPTGIAATLISVADEDGGWLGLLGLR